MIDVATARITSTAPASAFFERWGDMSTWHEWQSDMDWVRLDGPFAAGTTGVMKPEGGPKVPFVIERLTPGREFVDVSKLFGARLTVDHQVRDLPDGGCSVDIHYSMSGPLARVWLLILGKGLKASAQPDLDGLVKVVEHAAPRT